MIILESERLLFRQHEPHDLDAYCAMEMDPDVRRYVGGAPRSREESERRFRNALGSSPGRLGLWATILKQTGEYVGRSGLYQHVGPEGKPVSGEAALSFYIARAFWRQGLASEAARAFVRFGLEELHIQRIVAAVQAGNDASVRVLQKTGFELIATERGFRTFLKFALEQRSS